MVEKQWDGATERRMTELSRQAEEKQLQKEADGMLKKFTNERKAAGWRVVKDAFGVGVTVASGAGIVIGAAAVTLGAPEVAYPSILGGAAGAGVTWRYELYESFSSIGADWQAWREKAQKAAEMGGYVADKKYAEGISKLGKMRKR